MEIEYEVSYSNNGSGLCQTGGNCQLEEQEGRKCIKGKERMLLNKQTQEAATLSW